MPTSDGVSYLLAAASNAGCSQPDALGFRSFAHCRAVMYGTSAAAGASGALLASARPSPRALHSQRAPPAAMSAPRAGEIREIRKRNLHALRRAASEPRSREGGASEARSREAKSRDGRGGGSVEDWDPSEDWRDLWRRRSAAAPPAASHPSRPLNCTPPASPASLASPASPGSSAPSLAPFPAPFPTPFPAPSPRHSTPADRLAIPQGLRDPGIPQVACLLAGPVRSLLLPSVHVSMRANLLDAFGGERVLFA